MVKEVNQVSSFGLGYYTTNWAFSAIRRGNEFAEDLKLNWPGTAWLFKSWYCAPIFHRTLLYAYHAQTRCLNPENALIKFTRYSIPLATPTILTLSLTSSLTANFNETNRIRRSLSWLEGKILPTAIVIQTVSFAVFSLLGYPTLNEKSILPRTVAIGQLFAAMVQFAIAQSPEPITASITLANDAIQNLYSREYFALSLQIGLLAYAFLSTHHPKDKSSRLDQWIHAGRVGFNWSVGSFFVFSNGWKLYRGKGRLYDINAALSGMRMVLSETRWAGGRMDQVLDGIWHVLAGIRLVQCSPLRDLGEDRRLNLALHAAAVATEIKNIWKGKKR